MKLFAHMGATLIWHVLGFAPTFRQKPAVQRTGCAALASHFIEKRVGLCSWTFLREN